MNGSYFITKTFSIQLVKFISMMMLTVRKNIIRLLYITLYWLFQASEGTKSQQHHEPMIAMICPGKQGTDSRLFHNQYINPTDGKWTTDLDHKSTCRQDKVEILEYCKKVYPSTKIE